MVAESDLITTQLGSQFKKNFSSKPGAEKAGIFEVLGTMGPWAAVTCYYSVFKTVVFKKGLHSISRTGPESRVYMGGGDSIFDGYPFDPFPQ